MNVADADPASFRDPGGKVFRLGSNIYRTVTDHAATDFEFVQANGLLQKLIDAGWLVASRLVAPEILGDQARQARFVVEHEPLPFISYPYEWSFAALRAAAIHHIDVHLASLQYGATLSDATAYNIQFIGPRPIFIDLLSFRRYRPGEFWAGHRQFCEQFLNPLLLRSKLGVAHNSWYRGNLDGISAGSLSNLLPWHKKLSINILMHVEFQHRLQKKAETLSSEALPRRVNKAVLHLPAFKNMLSQLRRFISKLKPGDTGNTVWQNYAFSHNYSNAEFEIKRDFIARFSSVVKPDVLWDLGCNVGDFTKVALENGARASIGFDFDQGSLELAFDRARTEGLAFQPIFLDAANPSPNQGWNETERKGLSSRSRPDAVLALAFIHHMAIAKNIPLDAVTKWIVEMAPQGVIEFVPKEDRMVRRLLALREDIFPEYELNTFLNHLNRLASVVATETVTSSGRTLVWFER